jgi:hypothetical protein
MLPTNKILFVKTATFLLPKISLRRSRSNKTLKSASLMNTNEIKADFSSYF